MKEDFRKFLLDNDAAHDYVLDTYEYSRLPDIIGCFYRDGSWRVYETDERSRVTEERTFLSAVEAFQDAASRSGLSYASKMPDASTNNSNFMVRNRAAIEEALANMKKVESNLRGAASRSAVRADVVFLESMRNFASSNIIWPVKRASGQITGGVIVAAGQSDVKRSKAYVVGHKASRLYGIAKKSPSVKAGSINTNLMYKHTAASKPAAKAPHGRVSAKKSDEM